MGNPGLYADELYELGIMFSTIFKVNFVVVDKVDSENVLKY